MSRTLAIEVHINNYTTLSVELLDDVRNSTPYSKFSLSPCVINYLNVYNKANSGIFTPLENGLFTGNQIQRYQCQGVKKNGYSRRKNCEGCLNP